MVSIEKNIFSFYTVGLGTCWLWGQNAALKWHDADRIDNRVCQGRGVSDRKKLLFACGDHGVSDKYEKPV